MKITLNICATMTLLCGLALSTLAHGQVIQEELVRNSTSVLDDVMVVPAKQIPQMLLADARGVAIVPNVVKGGFVVGVRHGRGVLLIKGDNGQWLPPMFISLTGGSVGWQVGIQATDVVLVFRTRQSVNNLMTGRLTIGVDAAGAAGPVGRQASAATDATLSAEILSYSRSRGLFAGVSIDGSALQIDNNDGLAFYRRPVISPTGQLILDPANLPESAKVLMDRLARYSGSLPSAAQAVDAAAHAESVRQRLVAAWQQLSGILDPQWTAYLALPAGVRNANQQVAIEELDATLERYAAVSRDPTYASLTQRQEFSSTHELLKQYANLTANKSASRLRLPPPPAAQRDRY